MEGDEVRRLGGVSSLQRLRDGKRLPYRLDASAGGAALQGRPRRGSRYDSGFERALARVAG